MPADSASPMTAQASRRVVPHADGPHADDVRRAVESFSAGDRPRQRFAEQIAERRVEYDAIAGLLMVHATSGLDPREVEAVARSIAAGCLGEQHLWRDLGLPSRPVLRTLFETYFEAFAADNVMDMRWKKYIYRRLCRWGGYHTCKAPSCAACSDHAECFGTEA